MIFRYCIIGGAMLVLASCCSCHTQIAPAELRSFTVGVTTIADVKAKIGQPPETSTADGITTFVYTYNYEDDQWQNYLPIAGGLVGSFDKRIQRNVFVFNSDGTLKSYTQSDEINLPK